MDMAFSIKVPRDKFHFTKGFIETYSANTTEQAKAQGKIYDLNELPLLVADSQTSIDVPHKPKIHVRYPWWLVLIFPGIPIAALIVGGAGAVYGWRRLKRFGKRQ